MFAGVKEVGGIGPRPGVKYAPKWGTKVKEGVKQVGVKEGERNLAKALKNRGEALLSSFTQSREMSLFLLLSLFHPYIHPRAASARTREAVCEGG